MTDFNTCTFGFVGLGLIGGSIAKAIRAKYPECRIIAYNPSSDTLELALEEGVINEGLHEIGPAFLSCDYVFLCAPVSHNAKNLALIKPCLNPEAVLTDIGSTKTDIHEHIVNAGLTGQFIGGHPMAGSERTRYRNSKASLLENAYYIIAPEKETDPAKLESFRALIASIGALPIIVSCDTHDYAVAAISHLPHVISAALVNLVRDSDNPDGLMKMIAAGGFKDITRISSSSPVMWQQICLTNKDNILSLLDDYMDALSDMRAKIAQSESNAIYDFFNDARQYRDSFITSPATPSGPIPKEYIMHVNIADRPGVIAEVVIILALHQINIKNVGITHNREYQEGVLRIELNSSPDIAAAKETLESRGYEVF